MQRVLMHRRNVRIEKQGLQFESLLSLNSKKIRSTILTHFNNGVLYVIEVGKVKLAFSLQSLIEQGT